MPRPIPSVAGGGEREVVHPKLSGNLVFEFLAGDSGDVDGDQMGVRWGYEVEGKRHPGLRRARELVSIFVK